MSKDLEYYRSLRYKMVWEFDKDDGVYFVRFPELPGCLAHGDTEEEALGTALRVKDEWLEATYAAGWEIPEPSEVPDTTGRLTTRLPKYLHRQLIDRAEAEGVSLNQLILAFITQGLERASTEESLKKIAAMHEETLRLLSENTQTTGNQQWAAISSNSVLLQSLLRAEGVPIVGTAPCTAFYASELVAGVQGSTTTTANNAVLVNDCEERKRPELTIVRESAVG